MKRLVLVVVLAAACLGLLAAPAFAAEPTTFQDGVYVWVWGGWWTQYADNEVVAEGEPGIPIPAGQPVWLASGWVAYGYGLVKSIRTNIVYRVGIDGDMAVSTRAASKALWTQPSTIEGDTPPPFNPRMGVRFYASFWFLPVTLASGTHEVTVTETLRHMTIDLMGAGDRRPARYPAGSSEFTWDLVVP